MSQSIIHRAEKQLDYTRALRRDFHQHPEIGFQEIRTAGIVARELNDLGLEVNPGIAETGVVAMIEGEHPGPTALLRFDMDALPIQEETGAAYASTTPGVMHACGHDGHMAIGLTVARMLSQMRDQLYGNVKLIFQPAEEGLGGAKRMIEAGILENPRPDFSLALHLWNEMPYGWIGVTTGPVMAASETFRIVIQGKGGHGAVPHLATDPVIAASQIIGALQSIVSRNVPPLKSAVISVTTMHAGEAFNVIPPEVELKGTIRSFEPEVRALVLERFQRIVEGISQAMGCEAQVTIDSITPPVINDVQIAGRVQAIARELFPDEQIDTTVRTMGSEDMALIMQEIPGCYFFIGSANKQLGLDAPHHHPRFDFDERAMMYATALITRATIDLLNEI